MDKMQNIIALRNQGFSYNQIAEKLGISRSTIQSFCRRNKVEHESDNDDRLYEVCLCCNKKLNQNIKQKKKKFCSDSCRFKYWNKNKNQISGAKEKICPYCGNRFYDYGTKKYCSHSCYINFRFKNGVVT